MEAWSIEGKAKAKANPAAGPAHGCRTETNNVGNLFAIQTKISLAEPIFSSTLPPPANQRTRYCR